jgi:hypothetical protein
MDGWVGRLAGPRRVPPQGREQGRRCAGRVPLPVRPPVGALLLGSGSGTSFQKVGRGVGFGGRDLRQPSVKERSAVFGPLYRRRFGLSLRDSK